MAYLIDTHTFLWYAWGAPQLSPIAKNILEDSRNDLYISIASFWEMSIKVSTGKLTTIDNLRALERMAAEGGMRVLPITMSDLEMVAKLPWHHKDPFDRLIVATALARGLQVVGIDEQFDPYGVTRIWDGE